MGGHRGWKPRGERLPIREREILSGATITREETLGETKTTTTEGKIYMIRGTCRRGRRLLRKKGRILLNRKTP